MHKTYIYHEKGTPIIYSTPFIFGCKQKDKKFDDIEFMVYWINVYVPKDSNCYIKPVIKYCFYTITDNNGHSKLVVNKFKVEEGEKCFDINIDMARINNLVDSLLIFPKFTNILALEPIIHDGFSLMLRINKGDSSKTIKFIDNPYAKRQFLVKFYQYIDSLYRYKKYTESNDSLQAIKRKTEFLKHTLKMDSIAFPFLFNNRNSIKWISPEETKHHHKHSKKD